ncbi:MAG: SMP-30/gluconolactonase/LRE family protein [Clostridiales bacterium]|nr:SMP-30/gluconolactonase/LRE family protein [Clostridiales bacterium]
MNINLKIEKTSKTILGECPLWDYRTETLYYVDIKGQSIRKYNPETKEEHVIPTPQPVGAIALCNDGRMLVAMEDGIYYLEDKKFYMAHDECEIDGDRFNDGKVGPDGRFYVGTMGTDGSGAFYRLDGNGQLDRLFGNVTTSNGMDWSHDGKTFYYIDTALSRVDAFNFDIESGRISGGETVYDFKTERPDGMCIDEDGYLNIALWSGGKVVIIDPVRGKKVDKIIIPATHATCPAYGGKTMDTMYITSASLGMTNEPTEILAGMLFSVVMPRKGRKTYLFG